MRAVDYTNDHNNDSLSSFLCICFLFWTLICLLDGLFDSYRGGTYVSVRHWIHVEEILLQNNSDSENTHNSSLIVVELYLPLVIVLFPIVVSIVVCVT
jgi:hypothetical protein